MRIGLFLSSRDAPGLDALLGRFARAEADGFATAWVGQLFDYDALSLLALAGRATRRIELGTWVVPTPPRHPVVLAQQALTAHAAAGGRLALGIGVSHRVIVEDRLGLDYTRPIQHMREYLSALRPLLAGEQAQVEGRRLRVSAELTVPEASPPPPVLLAALGPKMLELAGAHADGVAIWLGGPRYLESFALPRLRREAARVGRPPPRVACGLPVVLTNDREGARAAAASFLSASSQLPSYRGVLEREGAVGPADVAVIGAEAELRRALARLAGLGVSDFTAVAIAVPGDPDAPSRTTAYLADLARRGGV